jgi:hypothetical protein
MGAYFNRVFDENGFILDHPDPAAVKHLRQVLFCLYKLKLPYSPSEEQAVMASFVKNEQDVSAFSLVGNPYIEGASYLIRDVLSGFDSDDVVPRHGPGAVATGEKGDKKWEFSRLYDCIHQRYPYYKYYVVGGARELSDRIDWYKSLQRLTTGKAKVVLVPKDSRGPRLISCEPLEFQWIQQGIMTKLIPYVEGHPLTKGHVNFTNQEINRRLAQSSSITGEYATLDLKDASDLVSMELVRALFKHVPRFLASLEAVRSSETVLPDGTVVPLSKHAPMGSALCFPVLALACWSVLVSGISKETRSFDRRVAEKVFIFGDDIIVPSEWASLCADVLESVGLKVNRQKSFSSGPFRESCGMDAFMGVDVTPIKVKTLWSGKPSDGSAYVSYMSYANNLLANGYVEASSFLFERLRTVFGRIPAGTKNASFPCKLVCDPIEAEIENLGKFRSRYNVDLQRYEFRVNRPLPRRQKSSLDGWHRLLRDLVTSVGDEPDVFVAPRSNRIKRGWTAVY